jgi:uncharacterized membrane protein HdeD (DUF308 family)
MAEPASKHNYSGIFGLVLILLGVFMLSLPLAALGFTAVGVGLLVIIRSLSLFTIGTFSGGPMTRWSLTLLSVLGLLIAILVFVSPVFSVVAVGVLVSVALLLLGVGDLIRGVSPIEMGTNRWIAILVGLLSFLVIGFITTATNAAGIIQPTATYSVIVGVLDIVFGAAYGGGEFQRTRAREVARERQQRARPA